jgi:hypothetical protein
VSDPYWTTSMTDPPNQHLWLTGDEEPTHEISAECACGPTSSALRTSDGELYLHQTTMADPPPAPLASGETVDELPHLFALVYVDAPVQVVVQLGYQASDAVPAAPDEDYAWVDATAADPAPDVGWIYEDDGTFSPGARDRLIAAARAAIDANQDYLTIDGPTADQVTAQVQALTEQINVVIELVTLPPPMGADPGLLSPYAPPSGPQPPV